MEAADRFPDCLRLDEDKCTYRRRECRAADKGLIGCRVACIWASGIAAIPICTWSI